MKMYAVSQVGRRATVSAVVCLLLASAAIAGETAASEDAKVQIGSWLEWDDMTGNWGGSRTQMEHAGFRPFASYMTDWLANADGGFKTGADLNGLWNFGFELDFEKMGGWDGGSFLMDWNWYHGNPFSEQLVGLNAVNNFSGWEASNAFRFYHIEYRQKFFGDRYEVRLGQVALDDHFMISDYASIFFSSPFSQFPTEATLSNAPVYPLCAPGIYLSGKPTDESFFRVGAYTNDAGLDIDSNNGFEWQIGGPAGYAILTEVGTHQKPFGLPGTYTLGGIYSTGELTRFSDGLAEEGAGAFWLMADQALAVDDQGNALVGAFTRFSWAPNDDLAACDFYADAGIVFTGILSCRPNDTFGFGFNYTSFSGPYVASLPAQGLSSTSSTTAFEITYQCHLAPWLTIQPDLQYILDPATSGQNALGLGLRTTLTF
jgi:porin